MILNETTTEKWLSYNIIFENVGYTKSGLEWTRGEGGASGKRTFIENMNYFYFFVNCKFFFDFSVI